jgi:hypothetical protein
MIMIIKVINSHHDGGITHHLKVPDWPIPVSQLRSRYPKCLRLERLLPRKLWHVS